MSYLDKDKIAKYPFLEDARNFLKDTGFTLEQFGNDPDLQVIVNKALDRVVADVEKKPYKSEIVQNKADSPALMKEAFSFIIAVVLLKLASANSLFNRFATAESKRAENFLTSDLGGRDREDRRDIKELTYVTNENKTKRDIAVQIIKEISGVTIQKPKTIKQLNEISEDTDQWEISVAEYVSRAILFHNIHWKLVNRNVQNGNVSLSSSEVVRLIEDEIWKNIKGKIATMPIPPLLPNFEKPVKEIVELAKKYAITTITSGEYPPCIKHAIEVLEKGENLPHTGRFMLGTYLLAKGQSIEQIAPLFKNAPDYNEKITIYQLEHLAGNSGSGTKYSCPSCEKLKSQNLCFAIPECDRIINPLQFGTKKKVNA